MSTLEVADTVVDTLDRVGSHLEIDYHAVGLTSDDVVESSWANIDEALN